MKTTIKEGKTKLLIDKADVVSKELEVFYNPKMELNRTVSIVLLQALERKNLQIGLPLAGTGVRGVRFLNELQEETIKHLALNDYNPEAKTYFEENLKLNNLDNETREKTASATTDKIITEEKISFAQEDANIFILKSKGFDYIDIDPFGSPNFLLDSAIARIARKGILAVTATDTAPLSGTYPETCKQKYWSKSAPSPNKHETALRILIRKVQLMGMQNEKALSPIFSYHYEHYYRIFFRVEKGKQKASALYDKLQAYHHYCPHCANTFATRETAQKTCERCGTQLSVAGPLYEGKLHDNDILEKMLKHLEQNPKPTAVEKEIQRMIENALKENRITSPAITSYDTHSIAKKQHFFIEKINTYIERLTEQNFEAEQSTFPPTGIKTNATFEEFLHIFRKE